MKVVEDKNKTKGSATLIEDSIPVDSGVKIEKNDLIEKAKKIAAGTIDNKWLEEGEKILSSMAPKLDNSLNSSVIDESPEEEQVHEKDETSAEQERILSLYNKETLEVASSMKDSLHLVLLGKSFSYTFSQEQNDIPGLHFSFKSLNSQDDLYCKNIARMNGWDRDMTPLSWELFVYEKVRKSLINYCGKDLSNVSEIDKNKFMDTSIKAFIKTKICEKYLVFEKALDLLSKGVGEYDLVKKYSALLR